MSTDSVAFRFSHDRKHLHDFFDHFILDEQRMRRRPEYELPVKVDGPIK